MKTWTLVWFLVFPPEGPNQDITWESIHENDLTQQQCLDRKEKNKRNFEHKLANGELVGFEIYCKDNRGTPVKIERRT